MTEKRINLWSSPRNISTAIMYSFAQRPDTSVVDEPLYAHYLVNTKSDVHHPVTQEVIDSQENDGAKVVDTMLHFDYGTPLIVFKQMTHHLIELDTAFFDDMDHVLLIRNPREIIQSYSKVIPNPGIDDIGVQKQAWLYEELTRLGKLRAIVETKELLLNPKGVLTQLCEKLDVPFYEAMLSWEAGARPEDGVWAPHWYSAVHKSTGFQAYEPKEIKLPPALEELAQACMPYFEELYEKALRA